MASSTPSNAGTNSVPVLAPERERASFSKDLRSVEGMRACIAHAGAVLDTGKAILKTLERFADVEKNQAVKLHAFRKSAMSKMKRLSEGRGVGTPPDVLGLGLGLGLGHVKRTGDREGSSVSELGLGDLADSRGDVGEVDGAGEVDGEGEEDGDDFTLPVAMGITVDRALLASATTHVHASRALLAGPIPNLRDTLVEMDTKKSDLGALGDTVMRPLVEARVAVEAKKAKYYMRAEKDLRTTKEWKDAGSGRLTKLYAAYIRRHGKAEFSRTEYLDSLTGLRIESADFVQSISTADVLGGLESVVCDVTAAVCAALYTTANILDDGWRGWEVRQCVMPVTETLNNQDLAESMRLAAGAASAEGDISTFISQYASAQAQEGRTPAPAPVEFESWAVGHEAYESPQSWWGNVRDRARQVKGRAVKAASSRARLVADRAHDVLDLRAHRGVTNLLPPRVSQDSRSLEFLVRKVTPKGVRLWRKVIIDIEHFEVSNCSRNGVVKQVFPATELQSVSKSRDALGSFIVTMSFAPLVGPEPDYSVAFSSEALYRSFCDALYLLKSGVPNKWRGTVRMRTGAGARSGNLRVSHYEAGDGVKSDADTQRTVGGIDADAEAKDRVGTGAGTGTGAETEAEAQSSDADADADAAFTQASNDRITVGTGGIETERLRVFVTTFNMGNAPLPTDISEWIPDPKGPEGGFDVYLITAQECSYEVKRADGTKSSSTLESGKHWKTALANFMGRDYSLIAYNSLWEIRVAMFAKKEHEENISQVVLDTEATGIAHVLGNKGGVGVSFQFHDSRIAFVGSHFAAHQNKVKERGINYHEIVQGLRLGTIKSLDLLSEHHHVIWAGDLNYRIDLARHDVVKLIEAGELETLLVADQLNKIRAEDDSDVLRGFSEMPIQFDPTYKFERGVSPRVYTEEKQRVPSWCDRVLWRSLPGWENRCRALSYFASESVTTSDHTPVTALFEIDAQLPFVDPSNLKRASVVLTQLSCRGIAASDANNLSDPFLTFSGPCLASTLRTPVKPKTLSPHWDDDEVPLLPLSKSSRDWLGWGHVGICVMDFDAASTDDCLGYAVVPLCLGLGSHPTPFRVAIYLGGEAMGEVSGTVHVIVASEEEVAPPMVADVMGSDAYPLDQISVDESVV